MNTVGIKTTIIDRNHLGLLCDIGELNALFAGSQNIEAFLNQIVALVANHLRADVCSIYLFDESMEEMVLKATRGLNPKSVNTIRLKLGEGLVGKAVKEMRAINERAASQNPHFKHIPGINEEPYDSFLCVPILRGLERIGALVVQRTPDRAFTNNDMLALKAITSQLAGAIASTRLLIDLHSRRKERASETAKIESRVIKATGATEGMVLGHAVIVDQGKQFQALREHKYKKEYTLAEFERAVRATEAQLEDFHAQMEGRLAGVASLIFDAHLLMLKDTEFAGAMSKKIQRGANPPEAILAVANRYIALFSQSTNTYMREKVKDVEDLARRLINNLVAGDKNDGMDWRGRIIVATDLYPSDMLKLSSDHVGGIILVTGGVTSHLSILARSLQMPLVIANDQQLLNLPENTMVLLDGTAGTIVIAPNQRLVDEFKDRAKILSQKKLVPAKVKAETYTKDHVRVHLLANVNLVMDVDNALAMKSEGIGLYRTEFAFMVGASFPTEEEQLAVYSALIERMGDKPVNIRTLDIGGDKVLSYFGDCNEPNPAMGMRSIRFSLSNKELFHQQLRAILRAGATASCLQITFPMICSLDEFLEAKASVDQCRDSLRVQDLPHCVHPRIGIMIETPSTVEIIDSLAEHADFFSIGTNDFVQYTLAADRSNPTISSYYTPHHPSILRSLKKIVAAANKRKIAVSICGEMAHDKSFLPFLLGIGIRTFSVNPRNNHRLQRQIARIDIHDAERLAAAVLAEDTIQGVARRLRVKAR